MMIFEQFNDLPVELRLKIFSFISKKKHLLNIALANKQCLNEVQPIIWESLRVSWHILEILKDVQKYKNFLRHTKRLLFADLRSRSQRKDILHQGYKSYPFYDILRYCEAEQVRNLTFRSFLVHGGLQLASEKLPLVTSLELKRIESEEFDRSWNYICSFRFLKELVIARCNVVDDHFKGIGNLKMLRVLKISNCRLLLGVCLEYINKVASTLTVFEFQRFPVGGLRGIDTQAYSYLLTNLKDIKVLSFKDTLLGGDFLELYANGLKHITSLDLCSTDINNYAMQFILTFTSLTNLDLSNCRITDEGVEHINRLELLEHLAVSQCEGITDLGLFYISKMKILKFLEIAECSSVTDYGITHLTNLKSLESLNLHGCHNLTDRSLQLIAETLELLEYVDASCEQFTIDGLDQLMSLQHLKWVDCDSEHITPEDLIEFCSRLQDLRSRVQ